MLNVDIETLSKRINECIRNELKFDEEELVEAISTMISDKLQKLDAKDIAKSIVEEMSI